VRLVARVNGHTYMYTYSPDETEHCLQVIRKHVSEGKLHPQVAMILMAMAQ
jgi:hypothetical protein